MRYKIEYLRESTKEDSVCHTVTIWAETLDEAGKAAFAESFVPRRILGADGFQIRDLSEGGAIVALETFEQD